MDVIMRKPRPMNESILTPSFLKRIGIGGLSIGVTTMIAFMIGYQGGNAVLAKYNGVRNIMYGASLHGFNS